ncbi:FadR/GntR family transcriptional regulator [Hephaestia sp. GCM10023244]|uniref:FadR/GntR family transcriptional regulator n=1 Tax=unclassified Hephaestia TaxID=2631281 RepID=UPI00207773D1|nr:FCD domain-containing protein [Hephaestia sp. MAHUQ-44]MCM8730631.1 FCD domain-containing protein [Hephaestia sp. MAHUQ-44]
MDDRGEPEGAGLLKGNLNRRLHSSLARELGRRILSGELPPGHLFPGEIDFSQQLDLSRSALREAFRILSAKGLVESRPKAGTHVTDPARWSRLDPDVLAWQFASEPSPEFLRDLFELRMIVEPAAAAAAAARRNEVQVAAMAAALDAMAAHGLATEEGRAADQLFHSLVIEAAHNQLLSTLSSSIMAAVAWTTIFKQRRRVLPRDPMPEHCALHAAIAAGDADGARNAMVVLIDLALADTEIAMRAEEGPPATT